MNMHTIILSTFVVALSSVSPLFCTKKASPNTGPTEKTAKTTNQIEQKKTQKLFEAKCKELSALIKAAENFNKTESKTLRDKTIEEIKNKLGEIRTATQKIALSKKTKTNCCKVWPEIKKTYANPEKFLENTHKYLDLLYKDPLLPKVLKFALQSLFVAVGVGIVGALSYGAYISGFQHSLQLTAALSSITFLLIQTDYFGIKTLFKKDQYI
ncbi:MAG: hypothetical protein V1855_05195 [bacterium]